VSTRPRPRSVTIRFVTVLQDEKANRELVDGVQVEIPGIGLIEPPGNG